ncbi:MAG TPA: hypothetical protein VIH99_13620 [Bdellovibrionota bacterium]|jgi:hypothetical protein
MRLPDRDDILDYVENAAGQDAEVQKRILHMLASSQILREHLSELKRDLYLVGSQIPDYAPEAAFGAELMRLSQLWLHASYKRKFSLREFYRSQEFFGLVLGLVGILLLGLGILGLRLLNK